MILNAIPYNRLDRKKKETGKKTLIKMINRYK
jgi:hypothetical protein